MGRVIRTKLRVGYLLPMFVVGLGALIGFLTAPSANASSSSTSTSTSSSSPSTTTSTTSSSRTSGSSGAFRVTIISSRRKSTDPITYQSLPKSYIGPGRALFETACSTCHGTEAEGSAVAPPIRGLGPATVDFWVGTGRMPLANPTAQPLRKPSRFTRQQTLEIAAFVSSIIPTSPDYPTGIPNVNLNKTNLAAGGSLFVLNCAPCHTITGSGDALADGFFAPSLHYATATQVAEAIRTGPTQMPHFGPGNLSDQQVADIVAYVTGPIQHPNNRGGIGLGGIGPVAEGFIGLIVGVGGLMLVARFIGDRA
jgi:ubiquinol-cytochrome c reductase cytochrome c subunit